MNTYEIITMACFIAAGVFFVISIVLFFVLDMVKVIGDLTGHTAKREIENIRSQNQMTGNKAYKPSKVNAERGKLTDKISPSGKIQQKDSMKFGGSVGTEKIASGGLNSGYEDTTLLESQEGSETTVLYSGANGAANEATSETTVLYQGSSETTVLNPEASETTVLNGSVMQDGTTVLNENQEAVALCVLQEIKFISTDELIY